MHSFRPDVEGLRFIAVIPIVLFHLDPALCPGGFIGVDIFFVISGYVITRMITKEGAGFSFRQFYFRRLFRLFPALLTTCTLSLVAGWFLLSPGDYVQLSWSVLTSALGGSNLYFYAVVDYFNDASYLHPLLHTWSLGAEEQFYLLWPALIVLTTRRHAALRAAGDTRGGVLRGHAVRADPRRRPCLLHDAVPHV